MKFCEYPLYITGVSHSRVMSFAYYELGAPQHFVSGNHIIPITRADQMRGIRPKMFDGSLLIIEGPVERCMPEFHEDLTNILAGRGFEFIAKDDHRIPYLIQRADQ